MFDVLKYFVLNLPLNIGIIINTTKIPFNTDDWKELLLLILGALLGWLIPRIYDVISKPKIEIALSNTDQSRTLKFLHIQISNKKRSFIGEILLGNRNVSYMQVYLSFYTSTGIKKVKARWVHDQEPATLGEAISPIKYQVLPYGETLQLDLAIKFNGEDEFYIFNHQNYLHQGPTQFRLYEHMINSEECKVMVEAISEGINWTQIFTIKNPSNLTADFTVINAK